MPKLSLLVLAILFFCSCRTFQYLTVDSPELPKDDKQANVLDNDTMRLTYSFTGAGGYLTVSVFNKTNEALFINWNRSALIRNDQSYSLAQASDGFISDLVRTGTGTVVPPQTNVSQVVLNLNLTLPNQLRVSLPDTAREQTVRLPQGAKRSYKAATIPESRSPLRMKIFLTFDTGSGSEFVESHSFYVGNVLQTSRVPDQFPLYHNGEMFYISWMTQGN